jgi:hypothetical protein
MTVTHPAGSGASTVISAPFKAKSAKNIGPKAPRRKTGDVGNSQYAVSPPPKTSPLRSLSALCGDTWTTAYLKFPCTCEVWDNRRANAVVVWRRGEHRIWCECQVAVMSNEQIMEAIA